MKRLISRKGLLVAIVLLLGGFGGYWLRDDSKSMREQGDETSSTETQPQGSEQKSKPETVVDTELERKIQNWAASHSGDYGVMVREATGDKRTASYQADKRFIAASTYKLFLIYGVLSQVEQGKLSLATNITGGKDIPACIDSMLLYSSNECGWPMGKLIGWSTVDEFLHQQGFKKTDLDNYDGSGNFVGDKYSSAADGAEFAWRLHAGTLLNQTHSDMMLSRMKRQVWRERIPAGVPEGIVVANKPGWLPGTENDTGIVYGSKSTYVIAIMSDGSSPQKLAALSKLIYDHLNS